MEIEEWNKKWGKIEKESWWVYGMGKGQKPPLCFIKNKQRNKKHKVVCGCSWVENLKCILRIIMPNVFAWRWSTTFPDIHKCSKIFVSIFFPLFLYIECGYWGSESSSFVHQILKHEFRYRRDHKIIGSLEHKEMLTSWISLRKAV